MVLTGPVCAARVPRALGMPQIVYSACCARHKPGRSRLIRLRAASGEQEQELADKVQQPAASEQVEGAWVQEVLAELTDSTQFGQRGEAWFAAQVVTLLLVAFPPEALRGAVDAAGWLAAAAGLGLAIAGQQVLGKNLTPLPQPRDSSTLVTSGIYQYCRHPMYGGLVLSSLGLALATGDELRFLFAALVFWVLDRKASYEEELLEKRYGSQYTEYRRFTKKLLPYIY